MHQTNGRVFFFQSNSGTTSVGKGKLNFDMKHKWMRVEIPP